MDYDLCWHNGGDVLVGESLKDGGLSRVVKTQHEDANLVAVRGYEDKESRKGQHNTDVI